MRKSGFRSSGRTATFGSFATATARITSCVGWFKSRFTPGFAYGVWASLSEQSYLEARRLYAEDAAGGPFFGWFMNSIGTFPETYALKLRSHFRPKLRPSLELEPTEHPLAVAQREGVSLATVIDWMEPHLHRNSEPSSE